MKGSNTQLFSLRLAERHAPFSWFVRSTAALVFLLLIFPVAFQKIAKAQQCSPLTATDDELGYRPRGNRCEGLYRSNVSGDSLQIVSLLESPLNYDLRVGGVLVVAPSFNPQISINVRATPLSIKTYYRMDAIMRQDQALRWPIRDVLSRINLGPSNLGVYGWSGPENEKVLVPVRVGLEGTPARRVQTALILRASINVAMAVWRWSALANNQCSDKYSAWQNAGLNSVGGSILVRISLANINSSMCVEVKAKEKNADWLPTLKTRIRRS